MSLNTALNAVIALIESRPEQFKEMLRGPASDIKDVSAVRARLQRALDYYAATKIRIGLMDTLHVGAGPDSDRTPPEKAPHFFAGVRAVENVFENLVDTLEKK